MKNNLLPGQMRFISFKKKKKKKVKDVFKAYLTVGAERTPVEEYPIISSWMVPTELGKVKIIPFSKWKDVGRHIGEYYICFYCEDDKFLAVLNNPKKYIKLFRRAKGIIGFDYSVYSDMPVYKQKSQMGDNLSLTFYYGMLNIKVIPNIRFGIEATCEDFLKAIPKRSTIAIGSYGCVHSKEEQERYRHFLKHILFELDPKNVIVYGAMPVEIFEPYLDKYTFIQSDAVTGHDKEEV
ncbi:MAG: DUF4417 domain-containing protein [Butyrivibrio sp.]|nr:DUF4417 domain-containing protein [Butyrivibrio sp.]